MNKKIDWPPACFINLMNDLDPDYDFTNWRKSKEWKIFVKGYNSGLYDAIIEINNRLYGEDNND